ncbi:N-acetylmuramoyl-L-alanine amidase-like domain-containing protein [Nitritalea halalkaliphila]|nr:N-acetylmuramoyl-L-alanine amidase-like domain-containing protein [Nitritalea halalkaliphila]
MSSAIFRLLILSVLLSSLSRELFGQQAQAAFHCSEADQMKIMELLAEAQDWQESSAGEQLLAFGKTFLGTPYVAKTLELPGPEQLVLHLSGLDCTTFLENVLALTMTARTGKTSFADYLEALQTVRYRDGQLEGYASRLHYFTDWIDSHVASGLLEEHTLQLGGEYRRQDFFFMSSHPEFYPQLRDPQALEAIRQQEKRLSQSRYPLLPKHKVAQAAASIQSGDLIAIHSQVKGIAITHVGFASWQEGTLHLLHAGTERMQVEISPQPLVDYLAAQSRVLGIRVMRLR